jgi:RecA-family ATPase
MLNPLVYQQAAENRYQMTVPAEEFDNEPIGFTFGEIRRLDIPPREELIFGLARGEVGMVNAVGNGGKTTLLRNLMVSLCTGRPFPPFGNFHTPRRVAFLDFEDTRSYMRNDILVMLNSLSSSEAALFDENSLFACEHRLNGSELTLSDPFHLHTVTLKLKAFEPDLIIVDTIASAFRIRDENNNAEVRNFITRPLKQLARDRNAALLAAHHIGKAKSEDGQTREASHKGRGASSFSDMSRLVLNLEKDNTGTKIILSCAKVKGPKFEDAIFELNTATRWFERRGTNREPSPYEIMIEMFDGLDEGAELTTRQCIEEFDGILPERSLMRLLNEGVKNGDLLRVRHGVYANCQTAKH